MSTQGMLTEQDKGSPMWGSLDTGGGKLADIE